MKINTVRVGEKVVFRPMGGGNAMYGEIVRLHSKYIFVRFHNDEVIRCNPRRLRYLEPVNK